MNKELVLNDKKSLLSAENFNHYLDVAGKLSKSGMVPKAMIGKPMDILIAMEMGGQLGLGTLQAIQDIAVINGKPCMYGDGLLAVVQGHPAYEWIREVKLEKNGVVTGYSCTLKRKGHEPQETVFTVDDAKLAKLWNPTNPKMSNSPWKTYPVRMLQMRARGFALRNLFSDALRGVKSIEEVRAYDVLDNKSKSADMKDKLAKYVTTTETETNHETIPVPVEVQVMASSVQLEKIDRLIVDNDFPENRVQGAFRYYKVQEFEGMTEKQADEFIALLDKS